MTKASDTPRFHHNMEKGKGGAVVDAVLDLLLAEGQVRGETRGRPGKYVYASALKVITERLDGVKPGTYDTCQNGSPGHVTYSYVSAAVLYLEALGLVTVLRAHGTKHGQSNVVERVTLA